MLTELLPDPVVAMVLHRTVPLWSLLVLVGLCLGLVVAVRPKRNAPGRTAFLLVSAFSQKYWVAELVRNLQSILDRRQIDLVIKVPERDYLSPSQLHHLRQISRNRTRYIGGFIIAADVEIARAQLATACRELNFPTVFIDVEPFEAEADYPANSAFIGYSANSIGETAARYVAALLRAKGRSEPVVLVIASREQRGRQHRFTEILPGLVPDVNLIRTDDGEFARLRAREQTLRQIAAAHLRGLLIDVIFCTNDEMALGAADALLMAGGCGARPDVVIVGVDGTAEAKATIDSGVSPFRATIVQDSYSLAEAAAEVLETKLAGRDTATRTALTPTVYEKRPDGLTTPPQHYLVTDEPSDKADPRP